MPGPARSCFLSNPSEACLISFEVLLILLGVPTEASSRLYLGKMPNSWCSECTFLAGDKWYCERREAALGSHLPRQWISEPLQSPLARHSRTLEPTSVYPELQEKMAVAP